MVVDGAVLDGGVGRAGFVDDAVIQMERVVVGVAGFSAGESAFGDSGWDEHPAMRRMAATAVVVMGCMQSYPP